jgi:hypothetical protein
MPFVSIFLKIGTYANRRGEAAVHAVVHVQVYFL